MKYQIDYDLMDDTLIHMPSLALGEQNILARKRLVEAAT